MAMWLRNNDRHHERETTKKKRRVCVSTRFWWRKDKKKENDTTRELLEMKKEKWERDMNGSQKKNAWIMGVARDWLQDELKNRLPGLSI